MIVTSEEFKELLDILCSENKLADTLINGKDGCKALGFTGLSDHLKLDALKRMGLERIECPISGMVQYKDIH